MSRLLELNVGTLAEVSTSVADTAQRLRMTPEHVRRLLRRGDRLAGVRLGSRWYVSRQSIDRYLGER